MSNRLLWLALLLSCLALAAAKPRTNHTRRIHDIGPVIGTDDHDYQPHERPHRRRHAAHNATHSSRSSSGGSEQSSVSDVIPQYNAHNNYYNDTTDTHYQLNSTDKMNKYDQAIAQAQAQQPHTVADSDSATSENKAKLDARKQDSEQDRVPKSHSAATVKSDRPSVVDKAAKHNRHTNATQPQQQQQDSMFSKPASDLDKTEQDKQDPEKQQQQPDTDSHLGKTEDAFPAKADSTVPPPQAQPVQPPPDLPPVPTQPYKMSINVKNYTIYVDKERYYVKGVHYSPSPIGVSTAMYPCTYTSTR